ncbi:hypothetical protein PC110_g22099 [Phytophthora cactorum]|uniref:Uncharacterized protein n=1 Tax=Phytophthora cactorum TaxID=29920 RepID=A0A329RE27_9STRA|nr:hypothetical protein PC110_g22099 [Phytophthora cactorum]
MIKKKKRANDNSEEPARAGDVAAESSEVVVEHEEEAALTKDDRNQIESFRELAIDEIDTYLNETVALLQQEEIDAVQRDEMELVRTIVQRFRTLGIYFRKSPKGSNGLRALQVDHFSVKEDEVKTPIVDCATRWNSCWKMLQRMTEKEGVLVKFFAHLKIRDGRKEFKDDEKKLRRPKAEDWLAIKCLQTLLGPFDVASHTLGGQSYPTMPLVLPALSGIRKHLGRTDLFAALAAEAGEEPYVAETVLMMDKCRKVMLALYVQRFEELEQSELRWVAFLDPRIEKWMSHLSPADTPKANEEHVAAMVALAQPYLPTIQTERRHQTPTEESNAQHRNFMRHHMFGPDVTQHVSTGLETACKK